MQYSVEKSSVGTIYISRFMVVSLRHSSNINVRVSNVGNTDVRVS
jgi:hypothetical protein